MKIKFEIEGKFIIRGEYFIFLKTLNPNIKFEITEETTLDGMKLKAFLEIPRLIDENGEQRFDLFAMKLHSEEDYLSIENGQIVELLSK